jgi:hypothetical protein
VKGSPPGGRQAILFTLFSNWQDAQPTLPVGTDRTMESSPAALEINDAEFTRICRKKVPPLRQPAQRTAEEYATTLRKWSRWGGAVPLEHLGRKDIREFIDWVHEDAASRQGTNPGRTANKVRSHLRAVLSWAWEHDLVDALPRFPRLKPQRDVAGRHYLTKPEINALYFATHQMRRPRGWSYPWPVGRYWRCALVVFFNYGVDTGTVWKTLPFHEPIRWRHVSWGRQSPDREIKEQCPWGWLYYHRVKTGKSFWRPMNRTVRLHLKSIRPEQEDLNAPVFMGGGSRPNSRFRQLCELAGLGPK